MLPRMFRASTKTGESHCCSRPSLYCVECEDLFANPKKQLTLGFLLCMLRLRMSMTG